MAFQYLRKLIFCAFMVPALASAQIVVGQTAGFSGPVAGGVNETTQGAMLWIDAVNAAGGVAGEKIELLSLDDGFVPARAAENARRLIADPRVVALFLTRGTPHTEAVLPLLAEAHMPLVAPSTGAMSLHDPLRKYLFNVRAPYQREAQKAVTHLYTIGIRRIAVVHADDSFGLDALQGAHAAFDKLKLEPVVVVKADRSKPDFAAIVPLLRKAEPQAVLWFGSGSSVADGVKALRSSGSAAQVVTLSNNASGAFIRDLGTAATGVIVTQVFPDARAAKFAFVKDAQALAHKKGIQNLSPAHLEGFAAARVLVEGLRRAGARPTRERLQAALENMQRFDIGGLEVSYSAQRHTGLEFADLSIITQDGHFRR
jgi:ABC-type branched-subunit amino acid transport system substrate-binding protein